LAYSSVNPSKPLDTGKCLYSEGQQSRKGISMAITNSGLVKSPDQGKHRIYGQVYKLNKHESTSIITVDILGQWDWCRYGYGQ